VTETLEAPPVSQGALRAELWPERSPLGVYAILDGARDPAIHRAVLGSGLPHACLYAGQLPRELVAAAPYVVKLQPDAALTGELLGKTWGRSWGVFALATASLEEMRRHLRKLLKVEDEQGRTLVFRYYDPRVLRVYLPTCRLDELAAVFGPVSVLAMESAQPAKLLRFHREVSGELGRAEVDLT
jgi:hypothetical protein